jgi:hypothetical protein
MVVFTFRYIKGRIGGSDFSTACIKVKPWLSVDESCLGSLGKFFDRDIAGGHSNHNIHKLSSANP